MHVPILKKLVVGIPMIEFRCLVGCDVYCSFLCLFVLALDEGKIDFSFVDTRQPNNMPNICKALSGKILLKPVGLQLVSFIDAMRLFGAHVLLFFACIIRQDKIEILLSLFSNYSRNTCPRACVCVEREREPQMANMHLLHTFPLIYVFVGIPMLMSVVLHSDHLIVLKIEIQGVSRCSFFFLSIRSLPSRHDIILLAHNFANELRCCNTN